MCKELEWISTCNLENVTVSAVSGGKPLFVWSTPPPPHPMRRTLGGGWIVDQGGNTARNAWDYSCVPPRRTLHPSETPASCVGLVTDTMTTVRAALTPPPPSPIRLTQRPYIIETMHSYTLPM